MHLGFRFGRFMQVCSLLGVCSSPDTWNLSWKVRNAEKKADESLKALANKSPVVVIASRVTHTKLGGRLHSAVLLSYALRTAVLTRHSCKHTIQLWKRSLTKSKESFCFSQSFVICIYRPEKLITKHKSCQSHWWVAKVPNSLKIFIAYQSIDPRTNIMKQWVQYLMVQSMLNFALTVINGKRGLIIYLLRKLGPST